MSIGKCQFESKGAMSEALQQFLRDYGDGLPESSIAHSTALANIDRWHAVCDSERPSDVQAAVYWEPSDWYLCTMKNLATAKEARGQGLGSQVVQAALADALAAKTPEGYDKCLVLAADITRGNTPSEKIFVKSGFEPVNTFCYAEGAEPARVLHWVRVPAKDGKCGA